MLIYATDTMTGRGLRRARRRLGFTQDQLGQQLDLHKNTLARIERGELLVMKTTELAVKYLLLVKESKPRRRA